jgi:hypothetical protein
MDLGERLLIYHELVMDLRRNLGEDYPDIPLIFEGLIGPYHGLVRGLHGLR